MYSKFMKEVDEKMIFGLERIENSRDIGQRDSDQTDIPQLNGYQKHLVHFEEMARQVDEYFALRKEEIYKTKR